MTMTKLSELDILNLVLTPLFLVISVWALRRKEAQYVYLVWFIFSFFLVLFFLLRIFAAGASLELEGAVGASGKAIFAYIYRTLTDSNSEIRLLLGMLSLVMLPQWLTYFLSGISGSASRPFFILRATEIAIWSFVKFTSGVAGILMADALADWSKNVLFQNIFNVSVALNFLAAAFMSLLCYKRSVPDIIDFLFSGRKFSMLRRVDDFFRRNSKQESE